MNAEQLDKLFEEYGYEAKERNETYRVYVLNQGMVAVGHLSHWSYTQAPVPAATRMQIFTIFIRFSIIILNLI